MAGIWPFSVYFFIFAGFASVAPFMVLYYQSLGFSGAQIGLLAGITPIITLLAAPLWTAFADATRRHRWVMNVSLLAGAATIFLFPYIHIFAPILLFAILFNAFFAPVNSLADSASMFMLGNRKEMYGRLRLGGTIGFGLAAPLIGILVQRYGLKVAFWGCTLFFILAFLLSQKLFYSPLRMSGSTGQGVRRLLLNPRWLLFLLMAFAGGLALAGTNTYFFSYLKELGAKESAMGLALTIGTLSEIPVLFFGHLLVQRFKPYGLLMLSMIFTGLRLLAFAASPLPIIALAIQLLNGLTFPAMWIAGVAYADEKAPAGLSATAQGVFGAVVFGIGNAVGGFAGGPLLESIGGRGMYLVFGSVVLVIWMVVALLEKALPPEPSKSAAAA